MKGNKFPTPGKPSQFHQWIGWRSKLEKKLDFENRGFESYSGNFQSYKLSRFHIYIKYLTFGLSLGFSSASFLAAASIEAAAPSNSFSAMTFGSSGSTQSDPRKYETKLVNRINLFQQEKGALEHLYTSRMVQEVFQGRDSN